MMIHSVSRMDNAPRILSMPKAEIKKSVSQNSYSQSPFTKEVANSFKSNSLNLAKTIKFTGALHGAFQDLNNSMVTCKTEDSKGESVGSRANINKLIHDYSGDFSKPNDAIKTTIQTGTKKIEGQDIPVLARTQLKLLDKDEQSEKQKLRFEMAVRIPSLNNNGYEAKSHNLAQQIDIDMTPINYKGEGTREQAYILNTKGNLMAVVEDGDDVLLTNAGRFSKKDDSTGSLDVSATETKNVFKPFVTQPQAVEHREVTPPIGEGTEIIIGMENGRFVNEIKNSIQEFVNKINNEEIILPQFKAAPNAKDTQLIMLAGGFGSRAEYTNASSSAIFHDETNGAQSTKGVFRTATGLTPMETTLVTLHKAGLLDCSKGSIGIGKNIKFYLNQGENRGNGEFSADLYDTMQKDGRKSAMIFPNDSMSRMTNAVIEANNIMQSGKAAMVIVAKEVPAQDCIKTFGIMKLDDNNQIVEFAEKPEVIPEGYEKNGKGVTNTFQFAVSDEAFKVLDIFEPYFIKSGNKESRDWSKQYIPIIKTLTQDEDYNVIRENLAKALNNKPENISDDLISQTKGMLAGQKLYAVPTSEPWADCGTLNQLYHTTMQIANNDFPLEDFERAHVLSCVDTQTGLVASTPEQKERISEKYDINGQIMVVPQAKKVEPEDVEDIPVTIHND